MAQRDYLSRNERTKEVPWKHQKERHTTGAKMQANTRDCPSSLKFSELCLTEQKAITPSNMALNVCRGNIQYNYIIHMRE